MNRASYYEPASAQAVPVLCALSWLLAARIVVASFLPPSCYRATYILQHRGGWNTKDQFQFVLHVSIPCQRKLDYNLSQL
jgi:hypothetical protein